MLKAILITICVFIVLRWVARVLLRSFLFKVAQQMQDPNAQGGFRGRTYTFGGNPFGSQQTSGSDNGAKVNTKKADKPNPDKLGGEYIDFEEVK